MPKKKKKRSGADRVKRLSFPEDERNHPWLKLLLDAYYILDKGIANAIESEQRKGRRLACGKGCSSCCAQSDIPVYPLEIAGISWYATEKISGSVRDILRIRLESSKRNDHCPFLIDGACSVHPVRPMACRQFNIFGKACLEGEDPYHTRREDVMAPVKRHVDQAFFIMLPFYGVKKESERTRVVETGAFHKMAKELHACKWMDLAEKMERFDKVKATP